MFVSRIALSVALIVPTAAYAQEAQPPVEPTTTDSGDIVVTAERRSTTLEKTPIAITYIGKDQIKEQNVATLRDFTGLAPNVEIPRFGQTPTTEQITIRGIGETDLIYNPKVATYIDDVYVPGAIGVMTNLSDVDHIEILRGPQGTLYGENTSGGAIRVVTREANDATHATGEIGLGDYGAVSARAYLSGPIIPGALAASVSVSRDRRDGFAYNPTLNTDVNDLDVDTLRAKLHYYGTDRLDIELAGDVTRDRSTTRYYSSPFQVGGLDPNLSSSGVPLYDHTGAGGVSLRIGYDLSDTLKLKSITAYRGYQQEANYDNQGVPGTVVNGFYGFNSANLVAYKSRTFTQELQLNGDFGAVTFASGLFYLHSKLDYDRRFYNNFSVGNLPRNQHGEQVEDNLAGYGQANVKLTEKLKVTLGARLGWQQVQADYALALLDGNLQRTSTVFSSSAKDSWTTLTPKIGLDYQWSPGVLQYASVSRGVNGGGYDTRSTNATDATTPFKPEFVTTYETGLKTTFWHHKARVNLAAFYNQFKDFQAAAFVPATGGQIRNNAGKAHTWGIEFEGHVAPVKGLEINGSAGYLEAKFDQYLNPVGLGTSFTGNTLPRAPQWTTNLNVGYTVPLPVPGTFKLSGNMQYSAKSFTDTANTESVASPGATIYDAFATYTLPGDRWSVTGSLRNLTDKRYVTYGLNTQFTSTRAFNDPRTVLFTIRYSY